MADELLRRFRGAGARQGRGLLSFTPSMPIYHVPISTPGHVTPLPTWPTDYTGTTYYVAASGGSTSLTGNSRTNPATASTALDNAPSLSTVVFLGAGPYPSTETIVDRPTNIHLKLIADVPCFTDLQNLAPTSVSAAGMDTLANSVVVGSNLTTSCRLRVLLIKSGGNIWVEGFRMENPDNWSVSATNGGSAGTTVRTWFEKCRWNQGGQINLRIGLQSGTTNQLNVVHKCWCISQNEVGDPGFPADGGIGGAGTAVTDYGVQGYNGTGSIMVLESFIQMRANHMVSTKRNAGLDRGAGKSRIEGCLFASWNRTDYTRRSTMIELGQEGDETGNDYTCFPVDILYNTFVDPNSLILYIKNQAAVVFDNNRVILQEDFLLTGIDTGSPPAIVLTTVNVGPYTISNNTIMPTNTPRCDLYSVGQATTITFSNNTTGNLIPVTAYNNFLVPSRFPDSTPTRITVNGDGVAGSGFATAVLG